MININTLQLNATYDAIDVNITTTTGNLFSKVLFWTADTFKDTSKAVDLSTLLAGTSETESFSIALTDLVSINLASFSGLFFIEFSSDDGGSPLTGVVGDLTEYHDCLIDDVLSIDINDCSALVKCSEVVDTCDNNIYYLNALFNNVYRALTSGYFDEAAKLFIKIEGITESCTNCCASTPVHHCASIYMINNEVKPCP